MSALAAMAALVGTISIGAIDDRPLFEGFGVWYGEDTKTAFVTNIQCFVGEAALNNDNFVRINWPDVKHGKGAFNSGWIKNLPVKFVVYSITSGVVPDGHLINLIKRRNTNNRISKFIVDIKGWNFSCIRNRNNDVVREVTQFFYRYITRSKPSAGVGGESIFGNFVLIPRCIGRLSSGGYRGFQAVQLAFGVVGHGGHGGGLCASGARLIGGGGCEASSIRGQGLGGGELSSSPTLIRSHYGELALHGTPLQQRGTEQTPRQDSDGPRPFDHIAVEFVVRTILILGATASAIFAVWNFVFWADRRWWWAWSAVGLIASVILVGHFAAR